MQSTEQPARLGPSVGGGRLWQRGLHGVTLWNVPETFPRAPGTLLTGRSRCGNSATQSLPRALQGPGRGGHRVCRSQLWRSQPNSRKLPTSRPSRNWARGRPQQEPGTGTPQQQEPGTGLPQQAQSQDTSLPPAVSPGPFQPSEAHTNSRDGGRSWVRRPAGNSPAPLTTQLRHCPRTATSAGPWRTFPENMAQASVLQPSAAAILPPSITVSSSLTNPRHLPGPCRPFSHSTLLPTPATLPFFQNIPLHHTCPVMVNACAKLTGHRLPDLGSEVTLGVSVRLFE